MKNGIIFCILLLVGNIVLIGCKKTQKNYTANMGGMHIWHGTYSGLDPFLDTTPPYIFTMPQSDTFAIKIINNSTISVQNTPLHFLYQNNTAQTYVFYGTDIPNSYFNGDSLTYFYNTGKMHYYSYAGSAAIQNNLDLYTP